MKLRRAMSCAILVLVCSLSLSLMAGSAEDARDAFDRGDYATALRLWRDLAAQGNAQAQYFLGSMYGTGRGATKDDAEAARWIRQAAKQGLAPAQYELGLMYRDGVGVAKDDAEMMRWYRKAADQGFAEAQHNLGVRYERGMGVARDDAEAATWYRKAAEQDRPNSQVNLGTMYAEGRGVQRDLVEAYKWLSLSVQGSQGPLRAEAIGRREQLAKALTQGQIAKGQQLAFEWKPTGQSPWGSQSPYTSPPSVVWKGQEAPVAEGQSVDLVSFVVGAPSGEGWKMQTNHNDAVEFRRSMSRSSFAIIRVDQMALAPGVDTGTNEGIIDTVQRFEVANMRERGIGRSYALGEVRNETEIVGDKKVYVMRYVVTDRSGQYPIEMNYAMYAYLPADVKQTRRMYLFLIGQPQKIGESEIKNDLRTIRPVISGLREKK
jgi:hypothetical protein